MAMHGYGIKNIMEVRPDDVGVISEAPAILGEGLFVANGKISWLDIEARQVFHNQRTYPLPYDIPSVIFEADESSLLLGTHRGIARLSNSGSLTHLVSLPGHDPEKFRLNDGCKLSDGSYLVGSMARREAGNLAGSIYRFTLSGEVTRYKWACHIPNSFVELEDGSVLISDSLKRVVFQVNFQQNDIQSKPWYHCQGPETPDGGCVLPNGQVALAMWGGACVRLFRPNGTPIEDLPVPVFQPTNCKYESLSKALVISSASVELSDELMHRYPLSGHVLTRKLEK